MKLAPKSFQYREKNKRHKKINKKWCKKEDNENKKRKTKYHSRKCVENFTVIEPEWLCISQRLRRTQHCEYFKQLYTNVMTVTP
jgi:hypothetical protein